MKSLHKDYSKILTDPLRSLLSGRSHHHGRPIEQPSSCFETNIQIGPQKGGQLPVMGIQARVSLSIYNRAIFNILQGQERPWETDDSQTTARAAWDAANQDLFSILLFSTGGPAFFVIWRFEGTTLEDGAGHGQQAWAALREKFRGSSRDAIRAEHAQMNNTPTRSGLDPDEYLYIMDSG